MRAVLLALVGGVSASIHGGLHPKIKKIVQLLNDMKATLDEDADNDAKVNEKMECWCKKNDKGLSEAQKASEERIALLRNRVTSNTARVAQKTTELEQCAKDITKVSTEMEEERERNKKTVDDLHADEVEYTQGIQQLNNAITVLSKHNTGLSQQRAIVSLKNHLTKHTDLLDSLLPNDREAVMGFLQQPQIEPTAQKGGYASQSGEIFGILNQMLETFQSDLQSNKDEQASNKKFHDENMGRMTEEAKTLDEKQSRLTSDKADANQQMTDDKQEIKDLESKMSEDAEFLKLVKEKCPKHRAEYEKRVKERHLEVDQINKAIEFLTSDAAYDTFGKMQKSMLFLQTSKIDIQRARLAQRLLRGAALKNPNGSKLSMLADRMGRDSFTKVKQAIDQMASELKEVLADEVTKKDKCVADLHDNEEEITAGNVALEGIAAKIESKNSELVEAKKAYADLTEEIATKDKDYKELKEDRAEAIKTFQTNVADNEAAIQLLDNAISALTYAYQEGPPSFLEFSAEPAEDKPSSEPLTHTEAPELQNEYKRNSSGNVVVAMLNEVVNDAKAQITLLNEAEAEAKTSFDQEREAINNSLRALGKAQTAKDGEVADLELTIQEEEQNQKDKLEEVSLLNDQKRNLHNDCDFLIKNFDLRQESINDEIEALQKVKAILSGAQLD